MELSNKNLVDQVRNMENAIIKNPRFVFQIDRVLVKAVRRPVGPEATDGHGGHLVDQLMDLHMPFLQ